MLAAHMCGHIAQRPAPAVSVTASKRTPRFLRPKHADGLRGSITRPSALGWNPIGSISAFASLTASIPAILQANAAALLVGLAAFATIVSLLVRSFSKGSRRYTGNVGEEYDTWTNDGLVEAYWGEHIHLGFYNEYERGQGEQGWLWKKDFKKAKYDFIDEMLKWSGAKQPKRVLDVGCGFGGTSRRLATVFPEADVQGITLSKEQVRRGGELCQERGINNVTFQVMDALEMTFPDNSFDLVWACESGEHMPDKKKYVEEMVRVLKPGGTLVIACWCQREERDKPFTQKDRDDLQFLYDEWAHPFFISKEEFVRLMDGTGHLEGSTSEDWKVQTLPSWRQSIWVGVVNPWPVILKFNLKVWWSVIREIVCIERMHQAFNSGLMEYGMMKATKKVPVAPAPPPITENYVRSQMLEFTRPSGGSFRLATSLLSVAPPDRSASPGAGDFGDPFSRPSGGAARLAVH